MGDWYVSLTGNSENPGTQELPWDLLSALGSKYSTVQPGDTIWIAAGTYVHPDRSVDSIGYTYRLYGTQAAPIHIRPIEGAHVIVDGGLNTYIGPPPATYVRIYDLEIIVAEAINDDRIEGEIDYPDGGVHIISGSGHKLINCSIHAACGNGIGLWAPADDDAEVYGCSIYDNGWYGTGKYRGHGIYTQNNADDGKFKHVRHCFFAQSWDYDIHVYSKTGKTDNFDIQGNIHWWKRGNPGGDLQIGGQNPSSNKHLYWTGNLAACSTIAFGYTVGGEDLRVENNVVLWGGMNTNVFDPVSWPHYPDANYNFWWHDVYWTTEWSGYFTANPEDGIPIPTSPLVHFHINEYDPLRAHVGAVGFQGESTFDIDVSEWLDDGDHYELLDPLDRWGTPVDTGIVSSGTITAPFNRSLPAWVNEADWRFDAFIIRKTTPAPPAGESNQRIIGDHCFSGPLTDQKIIGDYAVAFTAVIGTITFLADAGEATSPCVDINLYNVPYSCLIIGDHCFVAEPFYQRIVGNYAIDHRLGETLVPIVMQAEAGTAYATGYFSYVTPESCWQLRIRS